MWNSKVSGLIFINLAGNYIRPESHVLPRKSLQTPPIILPHSRALVTFPVGQQAFIITHFHHSERRDFVLPSSAGRQISIRCFLSSTRYKILRESLGPVPYHCQNGGCRLKNRQSLRRSQRFTVRCCQVVGK